jgi:hypothetical protein
MRIETTNGETLKCKLSNSDFSILRQARVLLEQVAFHERGSDDGKAAQDAAENIAGLVKSHAEPTKGEPSGN